MNKEERLTVQEQLEEIKECGKTFNNSQYYCLYKYDIEKIIPYIINLQQENKQLKEKIDIENTNYKTLSADIGTVAEYMKLDECAIIEEMIDRAVELVKKENIIDELEKWLKEEIKKYDNVGLKFKKQGNFECASRSYDYLKQYQTMLSKLQELKGSDKE